MRRRTNTFRMALVLMAFFLPAAVGRGDEAQLTNSITFYASFDHSVDADYGRGDRRLYWSPSLQRERSEPGLPAGGVVRRMAAGRYGEALEFTKKSETVIFYRGEGNIEYTDSALEGTISMWMRLSPDEDLAPGYVDPLQITDKSWNDACLFVDFTKDDVPRHFRLGVFSDYAVWNPQDRDWDSIPVADRPMVDVASPPFARDRWTHVGITFERFNTGESAAARLYLDGQFQGALEGPQRLSWDLQKVVVMLGIYYVGGLDELALFNRALTADEVQQVARSARPLSELMRDDTGAGGR